MILSEGYWPDLWQALFELREHDDPSLLLDFAALQLGEDPGAASFTEHVNCLDGLVLHAEIDRAVQLEEGRLTDAIIEERFPLLAIMNPSAPSACPFYDRFAPDPHQGPLDGGGVAILVIGNHADPATPFGESEELAIETLANGYLTEISHASHVIDPNNACVNGHVHRALLDGVYPAERRVECERQE